MTRVVVIGPYPPTADPRADVTLAQVRTWRATGAQVHVVSPSRSAAHHNLRLDTAWGALRLGGIVRDADRVVVVGDVTEPAGTVAARIVRWNLARARVVDLVTVASEPTGPADHHQICAIAGLGVGQIVALARAGGPTLARTILRRVAAHTARWRVRFR